MAGGSSRAFEGGVSRSSHHEADGISAVPAGDSVVLVHVEADPAGGITYSVVGGKPRMLQIGDEIAGARVGVIDTTRFLLLIEPGTGRLSAYCTVIGGSKIFYFGPRFGTWVDESGNVNRSPDIVHRMKAQKLPVAFNLQGSEMTIEIVINPNFRSAFNQDTVSTFDYGANSHQVQLTFDLPSGKFRRAKVLIQRNRGQDAASASFGVRGFPFVWPELKAETKPAPVGAFPPKTPAKPMPTVAAGAAGEPPRMKLAPRPAPPSGGPDGADPALEETSSGRIRLRPRSEGTPGPAPTSAPIAPPPRATLGPRSTSPPPSTPPPRDPPSAAPREAADGEAPRMKLRPAGGNSSSGTDSRGWSTPPPREAPAKGDPSRMTPVPDPPSQAAGEWIDDLLTGTGTSNATPVPDESPQRTPDPSLQARKKGVLTVPVQQLSIEDLIARIEGETDGETRWKMIEQNLILGREERTYQLVSRFAEEIDERTAQWPPARLRLAFGRIPGGILFGIMYHWKMNQVMAVAEENPEAEKVMTWLRERELDRMLQIDTSVEVTTAEAARRDLCVDRNADEPAIKKTWRTLLGFLNADHGRQDERAIHRKKDEIAKHLQTARNVLLRQR